MNDICGVVVTYNRKELLLRNIKSMLIQSYSLDLLIYDNNSTDGTLDYLKENGILENENVKYIKSPKNLGGAGGFENGLREAYGKGYRYFLLMDDDGYALNTETVKQLMDIAKKYENEPIIVNSLVVKNDNYDITFHLLDGIESYDDAVKMSKDGVLEAIAPFNGTLVSKECVDEIGFPRGEFFLSNDEYEYTLRAQHMGVPTLTAVDSLYFHPFQYDVRKAHFFGKELYVEEEKLWKTYFKTRNGIWVTNKYKGKLKGIKFAIKSIITAMYTEKKIAVLMTVLRAIYDGSTGKFSRIPDLSK
jgi:GT2 family glycosyltransferase